MVKVSDYIKDLSYNENLCFYVHIFVYVLITFCALPLQYRWCLFCPEWQEEKMPSKTEVVSAQTVNEGNEGNEAGRKMWGHGEISGTKVVRYVSC